MRLSERACPVISYGSVQTRRPLFPVPFTSRLGALEAEHVSRLSVIRSEFLRDAAETTSAGSIEAALDINGGWPADQHFRCVRHQRFLSLKLTAPIISDVVSPSGAFRVRIFKVSSRFTSPTPSPRPYPPTRAQTSPVDYSKHATKLVAIVVC